MRFGVLTDVQRGSNVWDEQWKTNKKPKFITNDDISLTVHVSPWVSSYLVSLRFTFDGFELTPTPQVCAKTEKRLLIMWEMFGFLFFKVPLLVASVPQVIRLLWRKSMMVCTPWTLVISVSVWDVTFYCIDSSPGKCNNVPLCLTPASHCGLVVKPCFRPLQCNEGTDVFIAGEQWLEVSTWAKTDEYIKSTQVPSEYFHTRIHINEAFNFFSTKCQCCLYYTCRVKWFSNNISQF